MPHEGFYHFWSCQNLEAPVISGESWFLWNAQNSFFSWCILVVGWGGRQKKRECISLVTNQCLYIFIQSLALHFFSFSQIMPIKMNDRAPHLHLPLPERSSLKRRRVGNVFFFFALFLFAFKGAFKVGQHILSENVGAKSCFIMLGNSLVLQEASRHNLPLASANLQQEFQMALVVCD